MTPLYGPNGKLIELQPVFKDGQHWIAVRFEGEERVLFGPCRDAKHARDEVAKGKARFLSQRSGMGN